MEESILTSIKKLLGLGEDYDVFDTDIIIHINSCLLVAWQLGVGKVEGRPKSITGADETWSEFFGEDEPIELIKSWMYLKIRLMFDPPTSGVLHQAMERQIQELEFRLNVQAETPLLDIGGDQDGSDRESG